MEKTIEITRAIATWEARTGKRFNHKALAAALWHVSPNDSRARNYHALLHGRTKRLTRDMIETICQMTSVDPNFLFGYGS